MTRGWSGRTQEGGPCGRTWETNGATDEPYTIAASRFGGDTATPARVTSATTSAQQSEKGNVFGAPRTASAHAAVFAGDGDASLRRRGKAKRGWAGVTHDHDQLVESDDGKRRIYFVAVTPDGNEVRRGFGLVVRRKAAVFLALAEDDETPYHSILLAEHGVIECVTVGTKSSSVRWPDGDISPSDPALKQLLEEGTKQFFAGQTRRPARSVHPPARLVAATPPSPDATVKKRRLCQRAAQAARLAEKRKVAKRTEEQKRRDKAKAARHAKSQTSASKTTTGAPSSKRPRATPTLTVPRPAHAPSLSPAKSPPRAAPSSPGHHHLTNRGRPYSPPRQNAPDSASAASPPALRRSPRHQDSVGRAGGLLGFQLLRRARHAEQNAQHDLEAVIQRRLRRATAEREDAESFMQLFLGGHLA